MVNRTLCDILNHCQQLIIQLDTLHTVSGEHFSINPYPATPYHIFVFAYLNHYLTQH